jgi:hypothetical protein
LQAKFEQKAKMLLSGERTEDILKRIWTIDASPNIKELVDLL